MAGGCARCGEPEHGQLMATPEEDIAEANARFDASDEGPWSNASSSVGTSGATLTEEAFMEAIRQLEMDRGHGPFVDVRSPEEVEALRIQALISWTLDAITKGFARLVKRSVVWTSAWPVLGSLGSPMLSVGDEALITNADGVVERITVVSRSGTNVMVASEGVPMRTIQKIGASLLLWKVAFSPSDIPGLIAWEDGSDHLVSEEWNARMWKLSAWAEGAIERGFARMTRRSIVWRLALGFGQGVAIQRLGRSFTIWGLFADGHHVVCGRGTHHDVCAMLPDGLLESASRALAKNGAWR